MPEALNMKIGYIRVSTQEQNIERQETMMKELEVDKIFIDKLSGKNTNRVQLKEMLDFVRQGDIVIVESFSRLARSTKDLLDIIEQLEKKGVLFISKKESIDTGTPSGRLMVTVFAGIAQFEREILLERQAEGIKEAKKAGKYKGRKPIKVNSETFKKLYIKWQNGEITAVQMQKELKLKPATFYRRVKEYEEKTEGQ